MALRGGKYRLRWGASWPWTPAFKLEREEGEMARCTVVVIWVTEEKGAAAREVRDVMESIPVLRGGGDIAIVI